MGKFIGGETADETTPSSGYGVFQTDTSGNLVHIDDSGNVLKIAAAGDFTFTIPATGTAALRGVANTFTAAQTFSSGIIFANETMSTYDEGTWTPTILGLSTAGTHTYTTQIGHYTKIGRLVLATFMVTINAKDGTMAGNAALGGLPFTVLNSGSSIGGSHMALWATMVNALVIFTVVPSTNATTASLFGATAATATLAALTAADFQNSSSLRGTLIYHATTS